MSKLTYLFLNIPDPPVKFIRELQACFYSFLWNDKPAKIKKSIVCRPYVEGGLRMIDVAAFNASLKLSWLKRISRPGNLQNLIYELFPAFENLEKLGGEYIHTCLRSCKNQFWVDVLRHLIQLYSKCRPLNYAEFLSEFIHYNKNILRQNRVIIIKEWIDNDILFIRQLYNVQEKRFCTFEEFRNIYPAIRRTNFLLYNGVIKTILEFQGKINIQAQQKIKVLEVKPWKVINEGGKSIQKILLHTKAQPAAVLKWNGDV